MCTVIYSQNVHYYLQSKCVLLSTVKMCTVIYSQNVHYYLQSKCVLLLKFKLLRKQESVDLLFVAQHTNDVTRRKEQVKKNRLILRGLIGAVCCFSDQKLPLHWNDFSSTSLNKKQFREFSQCVENFWSTSSKSFGFSYCYLILIN